MSAELELLKIISGKQDTHTGAIAKIDKKLAINNEQIKNIQKMGCAPGVSKVKEVHKRVDEVHTRLNNAKESGKKYTIFGGIIGGIILVIGLIIKYA